jgi:hypothetical protein
MKKELKEYIKSNKLSDDDILKLISIKSPPPESDVKDEDEESETQTDSEESEEADSGIAKESDDKSTLTKDSIEKMIADSIAKALGDTVKESPKVDVKKKTAPRPQPPSNQPIKSNQFGIRDH